MFDDKPPPLTIVVDAICGGDGSCRRLDEFICGCIVTKACGEIRNPCGGSCERPLEFEVIEAGTPGGGGGGGGCMEPVACDN